MGDQEQPPSNHSRIPFARAGCISTIALFVLIPFLMLMGATGLQERIVEFLKRQQAAGYIPAGWSADNLQTLAFALFSLLIVFVFFTVGYPAIRRQAYEDKMRAKEEASQKVLQEKHELREKRNRQQCKLKGKAFRRKLEKRRK